MFRCLQMLTLIALVAAGPVQAQDDAPTRRDAPARHDFSARSDAKAQEPPASGQLSPLERWGRLDPEQQERMRGRFERWQNLSNEERGAYQRRAREMQRAEREALRQLRPEDRKRFEKLDQSTREAVMKEMTHLLLVERTHRLRGKLPPEARKRLENAKPEDRMHVLERLRHDELHHAGDRALKDLARRLGLTEQQEELLALKRRAVERGIRDGARPEDMGEHDWERMRDLSPRDFARDWFRHNDRAQRTPEDRRRRRLQELLKPTLDELIEVSRAPDKDRRALLAALVRTRIQSIGTEKGDLPAKLLEELKGLSDREFINRMRRQARPQEPKGLRRPGEDGPRGPRDQRPGRAGQAHRPGPPGTDRPRPNDRPAPHRDRDHKRDGTTDAPHRQ